MREADRFRHALNCPDCGAHYEAETASPQSPIDMPCGRCWRELGPRDRAPCLRRLRSRPADQQALGHRDPVRYAPPTLQAYVRHLEAMIETLSSTEPAAEEDGEPVALDPAA